MCKEGAYKCIYTLARHKKYTKRDVKINNPNDDQEKKRRNTFVKS